MRSKKRPGFYSRRINRIPKKSFGHWRFSPWFNARASVALGYAISREVLAAVLYSEMDI